MRTGRSPSIRGLASTRALKEILRGPGRSVSLTRTCECINKRCTAGTVQAGMYEPTHSAAEKLNVSNMDTAIVRPGEVVYLLETSWVLQWLVRATSILELRSFTVRRRSSSTGPHTLLPPLLQTWAWLNTHQGMVAWCFVRDYDPRKISAW
jgi:hypothetical protein